CFPALMSRACWPGLWPLSPSCWRSTCSCCARQNAAPIAGGRMRLDLEAKSFGPRQVLGTLTLSVTRGERLAILGPSGIGKSTLLRILAGLDRQYQGQLQGAERLAMVFQEAVLLPWRDAVANITLPTGCDATTARDWLSEVGLEGHETKF